jgi:hypothetical protein
MLGRLAGSSLNGLYRLATRLPGPTRFPPTRKYFDANGEIQSRRYINSGGQPLNAQGHGTQSHVEKFLHLSDQIFWWAILYGAFTGSVIYVPKEKREVVGRVISKNLMKKECDPDLASFV